MVLLLVLCGASNLFGARLRQVAIVDLPGQPGFNQVAVANGQIVITRPATNTIEIFSPVKRRVVARISQVRDPRGIAVDDASQRVYVALGSGHIAVINSQNWQVEKLVRVAHSPEKLLWAPETKTLFSTSMLDRSISIIDPERGEESAVIELNARPADMLYDPARQVLLVTFEDTAEVATIDSSRQIAGRFKLAATAPTGLALDSARGRLYVAVRFAVLILDADSGTELVRIPAPGGTNGLVLDPGGKLLYAATGEGSVLAIDLSRNVLDHELPTDVKGYTLAYEPTRKMLYMPGGREGRSKMLILSPMTGEAAATQSAQNTAGKEQTTSK